MSASSVAGPPTLVAPLYTVVKPLAEALPTVSVIVPAYKVRTTLREAVDSVLRQTFRDLEVVVIDDASPDGCTEALVGLDDPRLGIFRLRRNVGLAGARNAGLALSRAPFVALLDGDDVSAPHRIVRQLAAFEGKPDLGLVGCLFNRIDLQGRIVTRGIDDWGLGDEALKPLMLFANPFPSVTMMMRRSAIPEEGFRAILAEDYAMAADVARHHDVAIVRETLVDYRVSPEGLMHTKFDQVSHDALVTQRRLLRDVGLAVNCYDPSLMAALMQFGAQPAGALSFDRMLALRRFMDDVERANAQSGWYPCDALAGAISTTWELVLLHATKLERMRFGRRYAVDLLVYRVSEGRRGVRARALVHSLLNIVRGSQAAA
jgi:glycosyltransferase involved in cell wall biosynthesis